MIKKNILAIALLSTLGFTNAADLENLRTTSYLNEPLRLQADVVGEGDIKLAAPTEYLRLNHPIPQYDLSIDVVEHNGQKQLILVTTEEIESPALTLLLESNDANNRRQLFELPILLDFKPEAPAEPVIEITESVDEPVLPALDSAEKAVESVAVAPKVDEKPEAKEEKTIATTVSAEKPVELAEVPSVVEKPQVEPSKPTAKKAEPTKTQEKQKNNDLIKRYGPVKKGETLWSIANKVRPSDITPQKMIEIIKENNPSAFSSNGTLLANVTLIIPGQIEEVQHQFVKSDEPTNNDRVAFIYELPEPPVKVTTIIPEPAPKQLQVEATEQSAKESTGTDQDFVTLAPEPLDEVNAPKVASTNSDVPVDTPISTNAVEVNHNLPVEDSTPPIETDQNVTAPIETQDTVVEVNTPVVEEISNVVETPKQVDQPVVETPVKKPIYIIPEPEPEPGIIELIFENIMYIGAGILVVILAILMIVLRRRKQDAGAPKDKEPKKSLFKKDKQKNTDNSVEAAVAASAVAATAIATAEEVTQPDVALAVEKETINNEEAIESVDFDLNFNELDSKITNEPVSSELDFTISEAVEEPIKVEESSIIDETPEYDALNFDLTSADEAAQFEAKEEPSSAPTLEVEEYGGLDFTLSPVDSSENLDNTVEAVQNDIEDYGGLDFVLSTNESQDESDKTTTKEEEVVEDYGGLDFTLSSEDSLDNSSLSLSDPVQTTSADNLEVLDFDLSSLSTVEVDDVSVEELLKSHAENLHQEAFGENNPLFSSKNYPDSEDTIAEEPEVIEMPEYISFPELLDNAENTLAEDIVEADKPKDFESLSEDQPADFAEFIETASNDSVDNHAKIDLSFIADAEDAEAGAAFLESLDFSDEKMHDDPIDNSVKDNVAKSAESLEEIQAINTTSLDMPEIIETEIVENNVDSLGDNTIDIDLLEPVSETVVEEFPMAIDDSVLLEDSVETHDLQPEISEELTVASINEPAVTSIISDDIIDADFESEQVKLELAVAYMDFDKSLAKPLLDEVVRDGNPSQIAKAKELLASIN